MKRKANTKYDNPNPFHHPDRAILLEGLGCSSPDCDGVYEPRFRDLTIGSRANPVVIKDSEYWECEVCGSFLTSLEETRRIREEKDRQKQDTVRVTLRMPATLHAKLTKDAATNHRSLNSEMVYQLSSSD